MKELRAAMLAFVVCVATSFALGYWVSQQRQQSGCFCDPCRCPGCCCGENCIPESESSK